MHENLAPSMEAEFRVRGNLADSMEAEFRTLEVLAPRRLGTSERAQWKRLAGGCATLRRVPASDCRRTGVAAKRALARSNGTNGQDCLSPDGGLHGIWRRAGVRHTNCAASGLHRPPTSMTSTTRRHRCECNALTGMRSAAPRHRSRRWPEKREVSTASTRSAPERSPLAMSSMRRLSPRARWSS